MKKLILVSFFALAIISSPAQQDTNKLPVTDSSLQITMPADSDLFKVDYKVDQEQMNRNMNSLVQMMDERKKKEKRTAMIRIGIGIAFLIVLIIGWRRRAVKK